MSQQPSELVRALMPLIEALDELGVAHYVGGSVASSAHGMPRSTQDVDLVAALLPVHADRLKEMLGQDYYADAEMIREAVVRRASFNVIHLETMIKLDVFAPKPREFAAEAMRRAQTTRVELEQGAEPVRMSTPEDIVLHKLEWYEMGNRISERQWLDVLGVLKLQGDALELDYLKRWAVEIGVDELLGDALREAGIEA